LIRGRQAVKHSTFSLGRFGFFINVATICWICLAVVLFCMPVAIPVTATSMNYASVVFAAFSTVAVVWYFVSARKSFKGPPVLSDLGPQEGLNVVASSSHRAELEDGGKEGFDGELKGR
jgi:hypothetical protein